MSILKTSSVPWSCPWTATGNYGGWNENAPIQQWSKAWLFVQMVKICFCSDLAVIQEFWALLTLTTPKTVSFRFTVWLSGHFVRWEVTPKRVAQRFKMEEEDAQVAWCCYGSAGLFFHGFKSSKYVQPEDLLRIQISPRAEGVFSKPWSWRWKLCFFTRIFGRIFVYPVASVCCKTPPCLFVFFIATLKTAMAAKKTINGPPGSGICSWKLRANGKWFLENTQSW